jgi:hypothetical protein
MNRPLGPLAVPVISAVGLILDKLPPPHGQEPVEIIESGCSRKAGVGFGGRRSSRS